VEAQGIGSIAPVLNVPERARPQLMVVEAAFFWKVILAARSGCLGPLGCYRNGRFPGVTFLFDHRGKPEQELA